MHPTVARIMKCNRTRHRNYLRRRGFLPMSASGLQVPEEFWEHGPPLRTRIYRGWYADPTLSAPWSTHWEEWESLRLLEQTVDGQLKTDKLIKDVFDLPGTVESVAYLVITGIEIFLFTGGGRYYFWSDGRLAVHHDGLELASPKEFLEYALKEGGNHLPDVDISMYPGAGAQVGYDCPEVSLNGTAQVGNTGIPSISGWMTRHAPGINADHTDSGSAEIAARPIAAPARRA
ncbi:hypothetical protein DFH09DRAFT_1097702 [Mycena vulgaris]|nr:hypothetical protein DFH09DRAFT_1097702 [Mycena vulgaris]